MLNFRKRWPKFFIIVPIVVVVLLLGGLAVTVHVADSLRYTHVTSSLVGVWMGEKGNVFELCADGTGRGSASGNNADTVFFRWNERDGTLRTFYEPKRKSLAMKTEQMLRGLPECAMSSFRIERADDGVLQLFSSYSNASFLVTRTNDEAFTLKHSQSKN